MKALKMSLALAFAALSTTSVGANVAMEEGVEGVEEAGGEAAGGWCCHYQYSIGNTHYYRCHRV